MKEKIILELAHVLWYTEEGRFLKSTEDMEESWSLNHKESIHTANAVYTLLVDRGVELKSSDTKKFLLS